MVISSTTTSFQKASPISDDILALRQVLTDCAASLAAGCPPIRQHPTRCIKQQNDVVILILPNWIVNFVCIKSDVWFASGGGLLEPHSTARLPMGKRRSASAELSVSVRAEILAPTRTFSCARIHVPPRSQSNETPRQFATGQ